MLPCALDAHVKELQKKYRREREFANVERCPVTTVVAQALPTDGRPQPTATATATRITTTTPMHFIQAAGRGAGIDLPQGYVSTPEMPFPLHHRSNSVQQLHISILKCGADVPKCYFRQQTEWVIRHDIRRAIWCQERGDDENHKHCHLLVEVHMAKTDTARLLVLKGMRGWLNNEKEGADYEKCRATFNKKPGYRVTCTFLNTSDGQTWKRMTGYLLKYKGADHRLEAVGLEENQQAHFLGIREQAMLKARRPVQEL